MKFNYTMKTKEHIKQMAVRKKYLEIFNGKLAKLKTDFTDSAKELGNHNELSKLPEHLHVDFYSNNSIGHHCNTLFIVNESIALQYRLKTTRIDLDCSVFVNSGELSKLLDNRLILEFKKFLDEIDLFASDVETALGTYTTYKKAVENMPWIESFHPDFDKKPVCKIVPIETIMKVNELMS